MRAITVMVMALALVGSAVAADKLELRGVKIGDTLDAVKAVHPDLDVDCFDVSGGPDPLAKQGCTFGRNKFRDGDFMIVLTAEGRVYSVDKTIQPFELDPTAEALIEKYGPPDSDERSEIKNRMGATFDQRILQWRSNDAILIAEKRGYRISEGTLILKRALAPKEEEAQALEAKKQAAAKNL